MLLVLNKAVKQRSVKAVYQPSGQHQNLKHVFTVSQSSFWFVLADWTQIGSTK